MLKLFLVMGAFVSVILAYQLFTHNTYAEISGHHIRYVMHHQFRFPGLFGLFYFIPIVVSLFTSGIRKMWYVGVMVFLSFVITVLFYREHLISVWCFFAAITSIMVWWMVSRMNTKGREEA